MSEQECSSPLAMQLPHFGIAAWSARTFIPRRELEPYRRFQITRSLARSAEQAGHRAPPTLPLLPRGVRALHLWLEVLVVLELFAVPGHLKRTRWARRGSGGGAARTVVRWDTARTQKGGGTRWNAGLVVEVEQAPQEKK